MITRSCLNNNILSLTCKQATLAGKVANALKAASKKTVCLSRKLISSSYTLKLLKCYKPFEDTVTFATKITFERSVSGALDIDLILKNNVYNGVGLTESSEDLAKYFSNAIKNQIGPSVVYITEVVGNVLYVYSYDNNADFSDVTNAILSNNNVSVTFENMQNNLYDLLNLWNNVSVEELLSIIKFTDNQVTTTNTAYSSNNCNC